MIDLRMNLRSITYIKFLFFVLLTWVVRPHVDITAFCRLGILSHALLSRFGCISPAINI